MKIEMLPNKIPTTCERFAENDLSSKIVKEDYERQQTKTESATAVMVGT